MGRSRIFKHDFFKSRSLSRCSRDARLTYVGLWCEADDKGRGIADPKILKGAIWPLDDDVTPAVIASHLCELAEEHITLYTKGRDVYYSVIEWEKHQAAAYRRGEPKHPDPTDPACTILHADECRSVPSFSFEVVECEREAAAPSTSPSAPPAVDNSSNDAAAFEQAVDEAVAIRRVQSRPEHPGRWEPAARAGIVKDYGSTMRLLLTRGCTPADAAKHALRGAEPPRVPPTPKHPKTCKCEGSGWVLVDENDESRTAEVRECDGPEATVHHLRGAS